MPDPAVLTALASIGLVPTEDLAEISVRPPRPREGGPRHPIAVDDEVEVGTAARSVVVRLRPLSELFEGTRVPPEFVGEPPRPWFGMFLLVERTLAALTCRREPAVTDREFERLYDLVRRRPDGRDAEPAFSCVRAAFRLTASVVPMSRAEFEAIARHLSRSARHFAEGHASRNYAERALFPLAPDDGLEDEE